VTAITLSISNSNSIWTRL